MKPTKFFVLFFVTALYFSPVFAQRWTLDSCLNYAVKNNKSLIADAQSVNAAVQERKSAKSQLLPQIEIRSEIDYYWKIPVQIFPGELVGQPSGTYVPLRLGTPWSGNYGVEARLNLIDVQQWKQIKMALLQEKAASLNYQDLKKQLLKNVRMAFYNNSVKQENTAIAQKEYKNYIEIHQLISQQFDQGIIDKIALNQSKSLLSDRQDYLSKSVSELKSSFLDLKFWMGFPLKDSLDILPFPQEPNPIFSNFNENALPEYESRKLSITVAKQNWAVSKASRFPNLSFTSNYQRIAYGENLNFIGNAKWYDIGFVGIRLSFPLLALNKTFYGPAKQKVLWEKARLEFEHYRNEKERDFLNETILLKESQLAIKQQQEHLVFAKENEHLTIKKIEKGLTDMIQLRQVQEDLYHTQEKLNDKKLDFFRHQTELLYLQGKHEY